ncbi:MAG: DNA polymerase III PolC-type [Thermoanaerobaculia bacterium]|nr:DNA polymerase III PolC-type [Thermoanaerobaculia bacterium]
MLGRYSRMERVSTSPVPDDLRSWDLCFVDVEATGHVFGFHEIIEIAVLRTSPDGMIEHATWARRLRPRFPERITTKAREITGFSQEGWAGAPLHDLALWNDFARFCRGSVPVCHNPTFDRAFITLAAAEYGVLDLGLDYHWIGTESLSWPLFRQGLIPRMSLVNLCEYFGVPPEPLPHGAMNGAESCRQVYVRLLRLLLSSAANPPIDAPR